MGIRQTFRDATAKLLKRMAVLIAVGIVLMVLGDYLEPRLTCTIWHLVPNLSIHIGTALIVAAGVIAAIDISLRKDFIEDVTNVIELVQAAERSGIRRIVYERKQLDSLIADDIRAAVPGSTIRVVGIAQKTLFTDQPGAGTLRDRIVEGCNFRILLLHPESSLVICVQNLSRHFGSPDVTRSIQASLAGAVRRTFEDARAAAPNLFGSLEVRLHKDLFSALFVYVGHSAVVCGTYLSHRRGTLSPAFVIEDPTFKKTLIDHFERLWTESENSRLCKVSRDGIVDDFSRHCG